MSALLLLVALGVAADLHWSADLEADDGGFLAYGETDQWEWGQVTVGPGGSYDGSACWGTQLARWYLNDTSDHLELPHVDLGGLARPVLGFYQWASFQDGDLAWLEASRGGAWETIAPIYGYPEGGEAFTDSHAQWQRVWVDLLGLEATDSLRLTFAADSAGAAAGWYVDEFTLWDGDPVPPDVTVEDCLADTEDVDGPYLVEVTVRDDVALAGASVLYEVGGGPAQTAPLVALGGDRWAGEIPGQPAGSVLTWGVTATDGQNQSFGPDPACTFAVRLPAPTGLRGPEDLVWGSSARLTWYPPQSGHETLGYRVWRDELQVAEVEAPRADVPLISGWQSFSVSARFDVGEGERSQAFPVEAAVPRVTSLEPTEGFQGDRLRLELRGEYLLMQQDDLVVDLGEPVRVTEIEVRDVDFAWVTVFISAQAPAGLADLTLTTWDQQVAWPAAFEILPGDERPRLLSITPDTLRQGDEADLTIAASAPFLAPPEVWIGDEVVVEEVALDADGSVAAHVVVPYTTPIGVHDVEVDDGTRIFGGLALTVRDRPAEVPGGCTALPRGRLPGWPLAALALALLRRRAYRPYRRPPSTGMETPRT